MREQWFFLTLLPIGDGQRSISFEKTSPGNPRSPAAQGSRWTSQRSRWTSQRHRRGRRDGGGFQKSAPDEPRISSKVQIFVEGLPLDAKIPDLVRYFSSAGEVKVDRTTKTPRVWLYHDKTTNQPTGECTITYTNNEAQVLALQFFDGQSYQGHFKLRVTPSIVKPHMASPVSLRGAKRGGPGRRMFRGGPRGRGTSSGGPRGRGTSSGGPMRREDRSNRHQPYPSTGHQNYNRGGGRPVGGFNHPPPPANDWYGQPRWVGGGYGGGKPY